MAGQAAPAVVAAASVGAAAAGQQFPTASLYVGDLDQNVNVNQLYDLFSQVSQVVSIRVCRDQRRRSSLGYAYVNFANLQDAAKAMELLNYTALNEKPIRIMFSHRDPSIRKSGNGNVFIKNLDTAIDNKALHDTFSTFGTVLSCKVALDSNGRSKGHGYVQFESEEAAQNAISYLNGKLLNDKPVYVGSFLRHQERLQANGSSKFTNVFVKNLCDTITNEDLKKIFGSYGTITSAVVIRDQNGKSKCFGFVNFQTPDSAESAVEKLNGSTFNEKVWFVGRAQRKSERDAELKAKFERERLNRYEKLKDANLYLKNLDDDISNEKLKELFSEFGTVTSCKVCVDSQGLSKGSGFVAFSTPEEASRAMSEMNGKMIGKKPLYVAVAQRKEERKARLQAQFSQIRGGLSLVPSGVPGYHPGEPMLPQQLYYGQGTPGMLPPQPAAGYGYQQQLMAGMRPGISTNFIMPYQHQRQNQPAQRMGMRHMGNPQQMQQQQQLLSRNNNQSLRYSGSARNNTESPVAPQGFVGPMMQIPFEAPGVPVAANEGQPAASKPISTLTSSLASATKEGGRAILGEQLYPIVLRLEPVHAGKVTGMLLEMDPTEVLHLIDSPDALQKKVSEAMQVLQDANASAVGDQLGSLALVE